MIPCNDTPAWRPTTHYTLLTVIHAAPEDNDPDNHVVVIVRNDELDEEVEFCVGWQESEFEETAGSGAQFDASRIWVGAATTLRRPSEPTDPEEGSNRLLVAYGFITKENFGDLFEEWLQGIKWPDGFDESIPTPGGGKKKKVKLKKVAAGGAKHAAPKAAARRKR